MLQPNSFSQPEAISWIQSAGSNQLDSVSRKQSAGFSQPDSVSRIQSDGNTEFIYEPNSSTYVYTVFICSLVISVIFNIMSIDLVMYISWGKSLPVSKLIK